MADIAAKQVAAGDAAASGQPQELLFGRLKILLLALQLREQIRNSVGVKPQAVHPAGKVGKELLQPRPGALGKVSTATDGGDALSAGAPISRASAATPSRRATIPADKLASRWAALSLSSSSSIRDPSAPEPFGLPPWTHPGRGRLTGIVLPPGRATS